MNYLGIDLSLTGTGLAKFEGTDIITDLCSAVVDCGRKKALDRVEELVAQVQDFMAKGPTVIALEGYSMNSIHRSYDIAEATGTLKMALRARPDTTLLIVAPKSLKLYAVGNGNADKKMILEGLKKAFPRRKITDHNEADAVYLAMLARDWHRSNRFPLEANRVRSLEKVFPAFPPCVKKL